MFADMTSGSMISKSPLDGGDLRSGTAPYMAVYHPRPVLVGGRAWGCFDPP